MLVVTWNVNSVKVREPRLLAWLEKHPADVVCLQELKLTEESFPHEGLRKLGYHAAVHGQRTYNGVAILSREPPRNVRRGLDDGVDDVQARLVAATIGGVEILCVYVPNGGEVGSDKWAYKLRWLERLSAYLERHHRPEQPLVLCGDFNVAPEERDVAKPDAWRDSVLCHPEARAALERLTAWGLRDTLRLHHAEGGFYSWWDYRQLAFPKNDGLRIDLILATAPLAGRCTRSWIDRDERKGKQPSDHVPVVAELELR